MKYLLVVSLILISVFSFSPGENTPALIVNNDKTSHALAFFLPSFLMHRTFIRVQTEKRMMFVISLGLAIEMIQFLFTARGFSLEDLMYDVIGVILYVSVYYGVRTMSSFFQSDQKKS